MPKQKNFRKFIKKHHKIIIVLLCIVWLGLFAAAVFSLWQNQQTVSANQKQRLAALDKRYNDLNAEALDLIAQQQSAKVQAFSEKSLHESLDHAKNSLNTSQLNSSPAILNDLELLIRYDQRKLDDAQAKQADTAATPGPQGEFITLPILLYHKPPADFEKQLQYLKQHGYTTVHMSDVANAFAHKSQLPKKPVVITFDDGFSEQLGAANLLKKYNMEATFYVILGGERSKWCIGIERRPGNCGDSYMNWNEVSGLAKNPLFEIGAHTINHLNLPSYPVDVQTAEINISKQALEQHLGIPITTFAYPYGANNATSVDIVRKAGFATAVTTQAGITQDEHAPFTLRRVRNALVLP